jgi:hypothetical protein
MTSKGLSEFRVYKERLADAPLEIHFDLEARNSLHLLLSIVRTFPFHRMPEIA